MIVDSDVDVHNTKTRNHSDKRKKQRPMENVMNIECQNIFPTLKSISISKVGHLVFKFSLTGGRFAPLSPSVTLLTALENL